MKAKKIGPGVYAVGPLGEIEMEQWVINERVAHGLPAPKKARHLTSASTRPGELASLEDAPTIERRAVTRPAGDA